MGHLTVVQQLLKKEIEEALNLPIRCFAWRECPALRMDRICYGMHCPAVRKEGCEKREEG